MSEERKKILKMIEEGMISSEEAEELLDSLDTAEEARVQANQVSTDIQWKQGKKQSQSGKAKRKSNLLNYVGEAFNKIKNVDLDFNFGTFFTVSHVFHHQSVDFSRLRVEMANGSIRLESWREADVRVECKAKVYQVDSQEQAREKFHHETEFRLDGELLHFSLPAQQVKTEVIIKVPEKHYRKIHCKLFNGNIYAEELRAEQFVGKTTNGLITLAAVTGTYLDAETANGSIKVDDGKWTDVELETINGRLQLDGVFRKVEAQVVSGSIHCNWREGSLGHTALFKTTTGSVRISLPRDLKINGQAETKIGNIHYDPENYQALNEKKDRINKFLQFAANETKENILYLEAETKTGSIWLLPASEEGTL